MVCVFDRFVCHLRPKIRLCQKRTCFWLNCLTLNWKFECYTSWCVVLRLCLYLWENVELFHEFCVSNLYFNFHHWFYLHAILWIQPIYYTANGSIKTEKIMNKLLWGKMQLCYPNMLPQISWWTFEARHWPDERHNWSGTVCLMRENNDHWFPRQAHTF